MKSIEQRGNFSFFFFLKEPVPGSPYSAQIFTDPNHVVVSGQSLASSAVGKTSYFKLSNVTGTVDDIKINVEGLPHSKQAPARRRVRGRNPTGFFFKVVFSFLYLFFLSSRFVIVRQVPQSRTDDFLTLLFLFIPLPPPS